MKTGEDRLYYIQVESNTPAINIEVDRLIWGVWATDIERAIKKLQVQVYSMTASVLDWFKYTQVEPVEEDELHAVLF